MDDAIQRQYETYPYPRRDPADEAQRLIVGSPSHLLEINHYVFAGRADVRRPWRVLVAGGGTGDGTLMLAQQLAWLGSPTEVIHLDISRPAIEIAEARAEMRGLTNIRFVQGSILDLAALDLGRFDYIDCCGVLHHLADPKKALAILAASLNDGGGMGIMVYGRYGRNGVYEAQQALRLLGRADDYDGARIDRAKRLCDSLPASNWLKRNDLITDHVHGGDAGLYDLLLHSRDRAYTVPEVFDLVASAGLAVSGFIEPALYDPATFLKDRELAREARALAWIDRCALAEMLGGHLKTHILYVVKSGSRATAVARPDRPEAVPVLREVDRAAMVARLGQGKRVKLDLRGVKVAFGVPPEAAAGLRLIDGKRSLGDIHAALAQASNGRFDWETFKKLFDTVYRIANAFNLMLITYPPEGTA